MTSVNNRNHVLQQSGNDVPDCFSCPISHDLMRDPIILKDGFTYEHQEIRKWLTQKATSPMTKQPLTLDGAQRNMALRNAIETHYGTTLPAPEPITALVPALVPSDFILCQVARKPEPRRTKWMGSHIPAVDTVYARPISNGFEAVWHIVQAPERIQRELYSPRFSSTHTTWSLYIGKKGLGLNLECGLPVSGAATVVVHHPSDDSQSRSREWASCTYQNQCAQTVIDGSRRAHYGEWPHDSIRHKDLLIANSKWIDEDLTLTLSLSMHFT